MKANLKAMHSGTDQAGIVLPVVMIFMVVMILLGVTVIRNAILEEKMAGGTLDQQRAFHAAEEILRICENEALKTNNRFFDAQEPIEIGNGAPDPRNWEIPEQWNNPLYRGRLGDNLNIPDVEVNIQGVARQPDCMVEVLLVFSGVIDGNDLQRYPRIVYRVTARGVGVAENTTIFVQSHFTPPLRKGS